MKREYATLTVIGSDKAGVIAAFTQRLFQLGANIEGLEEQVARGQFSMNLQASWAQRQFNPDMIRSALTTEARGLGMEMKLHFLKPGMHRLAILVTKEDHALKTLLSEAGFVAGKKKRGIIRLGAEPVVIIGSKPELEPLVKSYGLPFHFVNHRDRAAAEKEILALTDRYEVEFIALARYMKILSPNFVWRWKNKIVNIHPSLLPAFPGANAYRQAYEKGVRIIGVTAHIVTPSLDEGPIIDQQSFTIKPGEALPSIVRRGQALEGKCLANAVKAVVSNRLDIHWGRVYEV